MNIYSFDDICERFCNESGNTSTSGKLREKYVEILDAIGIEKTILQNKEKIITVNKESLKSESYIFPEESVDFCVSLLKKYVTKDFKELRKAKFLNISLSETQFLIDGFSNMILFLGYNLGEADKQRAKMDYRLKYSFRVALEKLERSFKKFELDVYDLLKKGMCSYEDAVMLADFASEKLDVLNEDWNGISDIFSDIRGDELSDIASEEANAIDMDAEVNSWMLYNALNNHDEYQANYIAMMKLLAEKNYVRQIKSRFNKYQEKLNGIKESEQIRLFGKTLQEDDSNVDNNLKLKHPFYVLIESISDYEEREKDRSDAKESEAAKTPNEIESERIQKEEQEKFIKKFCESRGIKWVLPRHYDIEEDFFAEGKNINMDIDKSIKLACCNSESAKVFPEKGVKGRCIIICSECKRRLVVDFSKKTSVKLNDLKDMKRVEKFKEINDSNYSLK